jgi:autotransporter-associated beta strand protein/T5SS/PEP-CTERM-associated repeat protein
VGFNTSSGTVTVNGAHWVISGTPPSSNTTLALGGGAGGTLTIENNATVSVGSKGAIIGNSSAGIGTAGTGTLTVGAGSTFTTNGIVGNVSVPATAVIDKGSATVSGAGAQWVNNGTLLIGALQSSTATATLTIGTGGVVTSTGGVILGGTNTGFASTGTLNISGGTLQTASIAQGTVGIAQANVIGGGTIQALQGNTGLNFINLGPSTLNIQSGTLTIDSNGFTVGTTALDGAGGLTKAGSGTLVLLANNGYAGPTTISAGTLQVGSGTPGLGSLGTSNAPIVDNGALVFDRPDSLTVSNAITGTGSVTQEGSGGTLILRGASTYSGGTTIVSGSKLEANGAGTLGTGPVLDNGALVMEGFGFVFGGVISGTGTLQTEGVVTLTANNSYSGGTTISGGTLRIGNGGPGGSVGSGPIAIASSGALIFDTSSNFTVPGAISGAGTVTQEASGTTTLNGNNTYTGATTISGGTLQVNGSIASSSMTTVSGGGTLTGTGTVGATQVNAGGIFQPGAANAPGSTMTINGSLAMASGAIYLVTVAGSQASHAVVNGTASVGGANIQVNLAGAPVSKNPILVLQTSGGVTGQFAQQTVVTNNFKATVSYTADDVFLTFQQADLVPPGSGRGQSLCGIGWTVNQCNVATALNNYFNTGGTLTSPFATVFGLSGSALGRALFELDGEDATGAERAAFQLTNQFLTLMLDPFVDGRMGGFNSAGGAIGFAPEQVNNLPSDVALAYASILNKNPAPANFDQRWTMWGGAFGGSSNTRGDPTVIGSSNVTANTYGFAAGADYHFTPSTTAGFALAGGGTSWGLSSGLGTGRSDALQAGVYGIHWMGPAYVGGALSFSNHWFTTSRTALGDNLGASFDGQSYGARVEGGYRIAALPILGVTPYGAVQFQDFATPAYSEGDSLSGGYALKYPSLNATDVRTEVGSRFDAPTLVNGMPLILRGRLAWAHDFVNNPALNPAFESLPGANFIVYGAPFPHDSALTSFGGELFLTPRWTLLAKFDGEFASNSQTYAGSGTLRYTW